MLEQSHVGPAFDRAEYSKLFILVVESRAATSSWTASTWRCTKHSETTASLRCS
jgi:hypothetical protein